jgi:transcriptional regulator GlxA family with amidase domain
VDNFEPPPERLHAIAFVKKTYPWLWYFISVCIGATLLARAGMLDGPRATTNKSAWGSAILQGPHVKWVPTARCVVDGNN